MPLPSFQILIVDDIPDNISMLFKFLTDHQFKVLVARSGEYALQVLERQLPDLILLDVMMPPGLDGFETCRRIKNHPKTSHIPIIFMTALSDTVDKIKGFQVGAVDYITKPFQHEEVLVRISNQLTLFQQRHQLQEQNQQLQEAMRLLMERTAELEKRNLELDSFAHTVAHDLKNPLAGILGLSELLISECTTMPKASKRIDMIHRACKQMFSIIHALLTLAGVSRQTQVNIEPLNMLDIIHQVMQHRLNFMIKEYQAIIHLSSEWPSALGYTPWVEEIWTNYISNGLKYGGQPPILELGATLTTNNSVRFWVRDNGKGLSPEAQTLLFTPFTRLHAKVEGHGLGLSIVQQIAEKLGGQVGIDSQLNQGSTFYFTLPMTS